MCNNHHGYGSSGDVFVYKFGVYENDRIVAIYGWNVPAFGAAKSVCAECPSAVLALTRMAAIPKSDRILKHVSKPLMIQMKKLIDRTRYPVLVTYSDRSMGHTGYVYQCSGWTKTDYNVVPYFEVDGVRVSKYNNGNTLTHMVKSGYATIDRWEHWQCDKGKVVEYMESSGWTRVESKVKLKSGNQAFTWSKFSGGTRVSREVTGE